MFRKLGLSIADAILVLDRYEIVLADFIERLMDGENEIQLFKDLNLADITATSNAIGSKKGNILYNNWRRKKIDDIEKIKNKKEQTVFDRLINRSEKTNTVFDRLKYFKER